MTRDLWAAEKRAWDRYMTEVQNDLRTHRGSLPVVLTAQTFSAGAAWRAAYMARTGR